MWSRWSCWAEAALASAEGPKPQTEFLTAPKGQEPSVMTTDMLSPGSTRGAVDRKARRLAKLYT
eukprot:253848-Heterocapsa_arctica.AAC.1